MNVSTRRGFSLVELLVVIAIIAILVGLLLPAVQSARESARRLECQNNMKQIGLAVLTYHATFNQLPASGIVAPSRGPYNPRSGKQFSWLVLILPHLEQSIVHDEFDFGRSVFQQPKEPQETYLPAYSCPTDSANGRLFFDTHLTGDKVFAKGNYAAYVSPYHVENQNRFPGALVAGNRQTFTNIVDGTTTTLLASEVLTRRHTNDQRGAWALPWTATSQLAFDMHDIEDPINYASSGYEPNLLALGLNQPPNNQGPNVDMLYACPDPADAQLKRMPCNVWEPGTNRQYLSAAPRSAHTTGVNVVYLDGHVGFLNDFVDGLTMSYLVSIEDGEIIDSGNLGR